MLPYHIPTMLPFTWHSQTAVMRWNYDLVHKYDSFWWLYLCKKCKIQKDSKGIYLSIAIFNLNSVLSFFTGCQ